MSDIKPSQHVSQTFVCMLLAMLLATGCVLRLPPYEAQPIANYEHTQTKDGLVVAIHPIVDAHESETYFGMDLLGARVLAVFVASENHAPSSSFILLKENISLHAGELKLQGTPDMARSDTTAEAIGWAGLAIISIPLMIIHNKMSEDTAALNHNFKTKEFQTRTLSPGQKAEGFIYFQLPDNKDLPSQWAIHLKAAEARSKEVSEFAFTFASRGQ